MRGLNIVVEGPDGAGKSTLVDSLMNELKGKRKIVLARHPGSTPVGTELRKLIKNRLDLEIDPYTIQVMMAADYCSFIATELEPNIQTGKIVLSDRSNLVSGLVYGLSSGLDPKRIEVLQETMLALNPEPMHLIVLTASPDDLRDRQHHDVVVRDGVRQEVECRFEKKGDEFRKKVCELYRYIGVKSQSESGFVSKRLDRYVAHREDNTLSIWPIRASTTADEVLARALCVVEKIAGLF